MGSGDAFVGLMAENVGCRWIFFTSATVSAAGMLMVRGMITFAGRLDNVAVRQAALIALAFNLLMVVAAIVSIMVTVPAGRTGGDTR